MAETDIKAWCRRNADGSLTVGILEDTFVEVPIVEEEEKPAPAPKKGRSRKK